MTLRIAHTADWHVGRRSFDRAAGGVNVRERDVELAVERTLDQIITARPDLLLIAGDVFDSIRPPNRSILFLFQQLSRMRVALPSMPIICVAGNHESPRSSDAGVILPLYRALGVTVVQQEVQRLQVAGCTVTAVPSVCARQLNGITPEGDGPHILLAHGDAHGLHPEANEFDAAVVAPRWSYSALGHYHCATEVAPNAWYSGAVDYTSSDPWSELREQAKRGLPGKGFLLVELTTGQPPVVTFQPIEAPRRFVDVEPIDATGLAVADLNTLLDARLSTVPDAAVARLIVDGVSRELRPFVDYPMLRRHKARLLHLTLELRRPAEQAATPAARAAVFKRLDQVVESFLQTRELPPDLERAEFVRLGMEHFVGKEPGQ